MVITVAFYEDLRAAQEATAALIEDGFNREDISIVSSNRQAIVSVTPLEGGAPGESGTPTKEFAGVRALIDSGIPRPEAEYYAQGVRYGGVLVTVQSSGRRAVRARQILSRHQPVDIYDRAFAWRNAGWTGYHEAPGTSAPTANPASQYEIVSEGFLHYQQEFNDHWEQNYSATGRPRDEYRRAYQFGYDAAYDSRFRRRTWESIAGQLAEEWARRYPDTRWTEMRDAVYYAWQRICCNTLDMAEPQAG